MRRLAFFFNTCGRKKGTHFNYTIKRALCQVKFFSSARMRPRLRFQENFAYAAYAPVSRKIRVWACARRHYQIRTPVRFHSLYGYVTNETDLIYERNSFSLRTKPNTCSIKWGALLLVHVFCPAAIRPFRCPTRFGVAYLVAALSTIT